MHNLMCYYMLSRAYVRGQIVQHKWGLILYVVGLSTGYMASFFGIWIILNRFKEIGNWNLGEIAFIYIICLLSAGISNILFVQFRGIGRMVESGEIDRILIRPINPIVNIMGTRFELNGFANIIVGLLLLFFLHDDINIQWHMMNIIKFIIALISATLVHGSIIIIIGSLSFIFIRTSGLDDMYSSFRDLVFYPVTIFDKPIQFILFFILPLAFASYVPAGMFLENPEYLNLPQWVWNISPIFGILLFLVSYSIWKLCLRRYQSTGS